MNCGSNLLAPLTTVTPGKLQIKSTEGNSFRFNGSLVFIVLNQQTLPFENLYFTINGSTIME